MGIILTVAPELNHSTLIIDQVWALVGKLNHTTHHQPALSPPTNDPPNTNHPAA